LISLLSHRWSCVWGYCIKGYGSSMGQKVDNWPSMSVPQIYSVTDCLKHLVSRLGIILMWHLATGWHLKLELEEILIHTMSTCWRVAFCSADLICYISLKVIVNTDTCLWNVCVCV
jgi:hypothetical protein